MANLTSKQEAFVREYAIDKNATQSAIRAEYSKKSAYSIG
jgi:phage terminase small subunit